MKLNILFDIIIGNDGLPLREVLEILQTLLEVHADGTSYLSVDVRDPLDTRMSVLKIMAALFKHCKIFSTIILNLYQKKLLLQWQSILKEAGVGD